MFLLTIDIARTGAGVKLTPNSIFPSSAGCKFATFSGVFLSLKYASALCAYRLAISAGRLGPLDRG